MTPDSANACLRDALVTSDQGLYTAELGNQRLVRSARRTGNRHMLFNLHVYSSWYRRHRPAMDFALSSPKWGVSSIATLSVERRVPYKSNAMTVLFFEDILRQEEIDVQVLHNTIP